jgi:hypothetical protein
MTSTKRIPNNKLFELSGISQWLGVSGIDIVGRLIVVEWCKLDVVSHFRGSLGEQRHHQSPRFVSEMSFGSGRSKSGVGAVIVD